ncbi:acyl-CoA desaturase [Pedobacter sp. HMF7647]|uniref:Acyl-CoA desaturase n=1 Tax=Hufsiella arboris TaxID=2695275 RepID=A0A7K1Y977_9SPHI|nr:acyl-CoA desaturase [Hufsiella arboris]MXV50588.1 acyl-CoA desaturase [Hufsiella arboris]
MSKISFNNSGSPFFKSLKQKVNGYFSENQLSKTGGTKLFLKGLLIAMSAVTLYVVLVFFTPHPYLSIALCVVLGINLSAIGFNIMHEGGHDSFSKHKWVNVLSAYSLNLLGGTIYFWKQKHNIDHHTYTNIDGMDHDIDVKFMRMHREQPRLWYHRFQHIYWVLLYGISYMAWILYQDFEKYFTGKMGKNGVSRPFNFKEHFIFWLTKAVYATVYLVIPVLMIGWLETLIGFLILSVACGLSLSIVFQLAHVVEETEFPVPENEKIEKEWAVHQINSTANFATKSKIVSWLLGGLNFQVEHHLFPGISHIHYPEINKLVKQTCEEFNVAYFEHRTMANALSSHLTHIRRLGKYSDMQ